MDGRPEGENVGMKKLTFPGLLVPRVAAHCPLTILWSDHDRLIGMGRGVLDFRERQDTRVDFDERLRDDHSNFPQQWMLAHSRQIHKTGYPRDAPIRAQAHATNENGLKKKEQSIAGKKSKSHAIIYEKRNKIWKETNLSSFERREIKRKKVNRDLTAETSYLLLFVQEFVVTLAGDQVALLQGNPVGHGPVVYLDTAHVGEVELNVVLQITIVDLGDKRS